MERAFFLIIAVSLAYGVGCMGRKRRIGFGWAFGLSLLNLLCACSLLAMSKSLLKNKLIPIIVHSNSIRYLYKKQQYYY